MRTGADVSFLQQLDWFMSTYAWHTVAGLFLAYALFLAVSNFLASREWAQTQAFVSDPERRATLDAERRRARDAQQRRANEAADAKRKREKESKRILSLDESNVDEEMNAIRAAAAAQSEHRRPNFTARKQARRGG